MLRRTTLIGLLAGGAALACRHRRRSPEDEVRAVLAAAQSAVAARDLDACRTLLSPRFAGPELPDRQAALALLRGLLGGRPRAPMVTHVAALDVEPPGQARATVVVAIAAVALETVQDLARAGADVVTLELGLAEEEGGAWRVTSAAWRAPGPADLL